MLLTSKALSVFIACSTLPTVARGNCIGRCNASSCAVESWFSVSPVGPDSKFARQSIISSTRQSRCFDLFALLVGSFAYTIQIYSNRVEGDVLRDCNGWTATAAVNMRDRKSVV